MSFPFLEVDIQQVLIASTFVAGMIGLSWLFGCALGRSFAVASVRVFVQLTLLGYVLNYVFSMENRWFILVLIECMVIVASIEAARRQEQWNARLVLSLLIALNVAVTTVLTFLFGAILQHNPLGLPNYFIPLAGMVIGSAANGAALAVHRLTGDIRSHRGEIEAALALGASPYRAIQPHLRSTVRLALIPSINTMMLTGLVQIPGIMGGMLIAGESPVAATRYQTIIMYMFPFGVMVSCLLTALLVSRAYFSPREQLLDI